jgi:hypothetical protein
MAIQKIIDIDNIETTSEQWWIIYNDETKTVIMGPMQCLGRVVSPHIMVIADTEEEILTYIKENDLIIPSEEYKDEQL